MKTDLIEEYIIGLKKKAMEYQLIDDGVGGDYWIKTLNEDDYIKVLEAEIRSLLLNCD
jgi:hypothetical protein